MLNFRNCLKKIVLSGDIDELCSSNYIILILFVRKLKKYSLIYKRVQNFEKKNLMTFFEASSKTTFY